MQCPHLDKEVTCVHLKGIEDASQRPKKDQENRERRQLSGVSPSEVTSCLEKTKHKTQYFILFVL